MTAKLAPRKQLRTGLTFLPAEVLAITTRPPFYRVLVDEGYWALIGPAGCDPWELGAMPPGEWDLILEEHFAGGCVFHFLASNLW